MVEGGSEKAFAQWLAERPQSFCEKVEAVAMDAFAGYKKAAARQVPHAVEILDPFHIVKLAGDKVTAVRCRLQREATGRRGTRTDPLYRGRRILLKTASLRTDRQKKRADELLGDPSNKPLALAHGVYQKIIACYAQEDRVYFVKSVFRVGGGAVFLDCDPRRRRPWRSTRGNSGNARSSCM